MNEYNAIEIGIDNDLDSSDDLSVAEERDTISLTPNAITPNLSRLMNVCSFSKNE